MRQARSYKFRLRPSATQGAALDAMLADFCGLYNACLQQRIEAYRRRGVALRYAQQAAELCAVRAEEPALARWSFTALQQVLRRVETTYTAFFRRKRGFPRFRAASRYHAAAFRIGDGLRLLKTGRLAVVGVTGGIKVVWHRTFPPGAKLGTAVLTRQLGKWYAVFSVEAEFGGAHGVGDVGLDLGLNALFATSDGHSEPAPQFERRAHKAQRRRQRALSRCKRGSRRRDEARARLAAGAARISRQRRNHAHKLSRELVSRYARLAFEDLSAAALARSRLARSIHDAAWRTLVNMTTYKAESAGAVVQLVDPRGTSQTCPSCGAVAAKPLALRRHTCACGSDLDRDVAAAQVVRDRAFGPGYGLWSLSVRVAA
ncbi:transposase [Methylobacterium sp. NEAU K]|uniref:RNA-guided endonuclease InsQ/TnpB family protein n=1 Tax=Methylobacterium sp. NEAU K TaxID=3064946 RepID=UPI002732A029|nr:transposase [Methylobacterium sp. NEAU K]MDP4002734.1 transposase [Methylobacterium sp. NEAU K]